MKCLVACEFSGAVRQAFAAKGHDAWSCDLLPSDDNSPNHIIGDVLGLLGDGWDVLIAFPPCQYLCSSGLHWNGRIEGRAEKTESALEFVRALFAAPIRKIAIENSRGCISTRICKPTQTIQPHQFGEDASKTTDLWLLNLPPLQPTGFVLPRMVNGMKRWANQTDSGQNRLGPSADRWKLRSKTYHGIAEAMATQWSGA